MRWINFLERRFGFLAVPGLIRVLVALNTVVCVMLFARPDFAGVLTLQPGKVMQGEVWRLFSYIIIPPYAPGSIFSLVWVFFYLNFLWLLGEGLEQAWGSFKLNLFYLFGMLGTTISVFWFGAVDATGVWLNLSLFFAFATLFPNYPILLYVIPIRVKWIALFSFVEVGLQLLGGDTSSRAAILVSLGNYLLFFGPEWVRYWREEGRTVKRRQRFQIAQKREAAETLHQCTVCGSTEVSAPETEFRVAADGEEYCTQHLPSRGTVELPVPGA